MTGRHRGVVAWNLALRQLEAKRNFYVPLLAQVIDGKTLSLRGETEQRDYREVGKYLK